MDQKFKSRPPMKFDVSHKHMEMIANSMFEKAGGYKTLKICENTV
jgi:hypothetical protein